MPITRAIIDSYMRVRSADLTPSEGVNEITGLNGMGKSSFLNAIATMGGKKNVAFKPIHDGEEEAKIVIEMDGVGEVPIRMIRRFYTKESGEIGETLVIEGPGGARFQKPQALLDAIVGEFSFDPLAILSMDDKKLLDTLKRFVPGYDFEEHEAAYKADFETRTDVNRRLKDLKSQVAGFSVPAETPDEEIDVSALADELQKVGEHNASIETRRANRQRVADEAVRFREEAEALDQQAADYRRLAEEAETKAQEKRLSADDNDKRLADAGELPAAKDAGEIRAKMSAAEQTNAAVREKRRMNVLIAQAEEAQKEADALTKSLAERNAKKAEAIRKAKMPVEGLSFDEDGIILLNGQPLSQASQAEKIRVSVALAAAMSPKLKVAIIKDGSLLDRNSWGLLEKYAEEHGLQVFVETVDSSRPTAIVIEDGVMRAPVMEAAE